MMEQFINTRTIGLMQGNPFISPLKPYTELVSSVLILEPFYPVEHANLVLYSSTCLI